MPKHVACFAHGGRYLLVIWDEIDRNLATKAVANDPRGALSR